MRRRATVVAGVASALALLCSGSAIAATFEVTRTNDPDPGNCKPRDCSLREAVRAANARMGADKIVLPDSERYRLSRQNPGGVPEDGALTGDLDVTNDPLAIVHPRRGKATIDANEIDRVFEIFDGAPTRFVKLRITGGADSSDNGGGGVRADANVTFVRSAVVANASTSIGGGIDADLDADAIFKRSLISRNRTVTTGAGIATSVPGRLVLERSRVTKNRSENFAAGVQLISSTESVIDRSTIERNRAVEDDGGGLLVVDGDPAGTAGVLRVTDSTISDNRSGDAGGGVLVRDQVVRITNSTISGNTADEYGGGIYSEEDDEVTQVVLNAVTVVRNNADSDAPAPARLGGGLFHFDSDVSVRNSLIALNGLGTDGLPRNDCEGDSFGSLGANLLSTTNEGECEGFAHPTDIVRPNPKLGKLTRNGGPTKTVALRKGSPAIGKAHRGSAPNRDQRGRKRDRRPDIGAYERGA